jgi:hypothetical protein
MQALDHEPRDATIPENPPKCRHFRLSRRIPGKQNAWGEAPVAHL